MNLTDTHCHIHFPDYGVDPELAIQNAREAGVTLLMCVGCTLHDSQRAVEFAAKYDNIWASIGLHPHEGANYIDDDRALAQFRELADKSGVVAIGECGLDYYYENSPREDQKKLLRFQLDLATQKELPLIFHVRDAFDDFWEIFDEFNKDSKKIRGVIHSFTGSQKDLNNILARDLHVGLNGIMTFTKNTEQLEVAKKIPMNKLLLETDAPFLTPTPYRGTICEPKHIREITQFLADLRGEKLSELAAATTQNAKALFKLEATID